VTDLDFTYASLPKETIRFLEEVMPSAHVEEDGQNGNGEGGSGRTYDCMS
jgi:hypothetical protein